jgi:hypothetical protein
MKLAGHASTRRLQEWLSLAAEGKAEPARASYRRGIEAARQSGSLAFAQKLLILAGGTAASASTERS